MERGFRAGCSVDRRNRFLASLPPASISTNTPGLVMGAPLTIAPSPYCFRICTLPLDRIAGIICCARSPFAVCLVLAFSIWTSLLHNYCNFSSYFIYHQNIEDLLLHTLWFWTTPRFHQKHRCPNCTRLVPYALVSAKMRNVPIVGFFPYPFKRRPATRGP
jgi:hypothetical protein